VSVVHETSDLRPAFRALHRGQVLGVLIDQGRRWPGVAVPFFGRPAHVTTAAAEIARRTGASLVPMAIQRRGMRQQVTILPAVDVDWTQPGAVAAATATLARSLESLIWRSPTQWAWTYATWGSAAEPDSAAPRAGSGRDEDGAPAREGDAVMDAEASAMKTARAGTRAGVASRLLAAVGVLLVAAGLAAGGLGCSEDRPAPPARTAPVGEALPSQEITDFVMRETNESGRLTWIFRAAEARIFEARDDVEARGIRIDFYDAEGRVGSVLSADRAVIQRRTNDMHATGNVVVRNAAGQELHTEELMYSSERDKIFTDKFVRVIRGRDLLTGYGLETDPDLEGGQLEIQRDFRATVRDEAVPDLGVGATGGAAPGAGGGASGGATESERGGAVGAGGPDGTP
jgi:LPS export ABC transporter protein LptC